MRSLLKVVFWLAGVLGVVLAALYVLFFDVWVVPTDDPILSASIAPTLSPGDVILVSKHGSVGYGNLLRCTDPQAAGRYVVARAIGHSGDKVAIEDDLVRVDGHRSPSPHACDVTQQTLRDPTTDDDIDLVCSVEDYGEVEFETLRAAGHAAPPFAMTVDPGRWFLVSDDRHIHVDSRDYGAVDPRTCKHVVFRVVSARGFRDVKSRFNVIW